MTIQASTPRLGPTRY